MFTKDTINILKNFAKINKNILFEQGNVLRTVAVDESMYAEVQLPFNITSPAPLADLQKFLVALNLVGVDDGLNVAFNEDKAVLSNKQKTVFYNYANVEHLVLPEGDMDDVVDGVSFTMNTECLQYILSACTSFNLKDIMFKTENGNLYVTLLNEEELLENTFNYKLAENTPDVFSTIKFDRFTVAVDEYECVLAQDEDGGVLFMKGKTLGVKYWIGCN